MQPFYLIKHPTTGKVYRVAADAQSKVETSGASRSIDQVVLHNMGAEHEGILELPGFAPWLDSIPTV